MAEFDFESALDAKYGKGEWHCDDIYSNKSYPTCVIDYLHVARAPAHGLGMENVALYATYKGKRVRVTMTSRLGDVGIMYKLAKDRGYDVRVFLPDLTDFSSTPVYPLPEVSEFLTAFKDDIE